MVRNPILELPPFFPHRIGDEKERQFQNWNLFRLNWVVLILSKKIKKLNLLQKSKHCQTGLVCYQLTYKWPNLFLYKIFCDRIDNASRKGLEKIVFTAFYGWFMHAVIAISQAKNPLRLKFRLADLIASLVMSFRFNYVEMASPWKIQDRKISKRSTLPKVSSRTNKTKWIWIWPREKTIFCHKRP